MPPEPSSASTTTTVARVRQGDGVTLPTWDGYRIVHVIENCLVGDMRQLRVLDAGEERTVSLRGGDPAIVHDHVERLTLPEGSAPVAPELLPPPDLQRFEHPYESTINFRGLQLLIENAIGSTRSGVDADGKPWSITMQAHYGEIANSVGADNDPIDVYVGPDLYAPMVYVMQTKDVRTGEFDEVKAFLGFRSKREALDMFRAHYNRPGFLWGVVEWPFDDFVMATLDRRVARGKMSRV